MRLVKPLVVAAIAAAAGAFAAGQNLTVVSKVTRDGGPPETTTSYLSSERVRMAQGDGREVMVEYKLGHMISIDHGKKTYSVMTKKDMDEWSARVQAQMNSPEMRKAREAMKNLPPEERRAIERASIGTFEVKKTGTSRRIAGYACENWTTEIAQISRSEQCLTTELKVPAQLFEMYEHYMESLRALSTSMGAMGPDASKMGEQLKKMRGYPLAVTTTVEIMGRKSVTVSEVIEVRYTPIPPSAWQIPAGYKKVETSFVGAPETRRRRQG